MMRRIVNNDDRIIQLVKTIEDLNSRLNICDYRIKHAPNHETEKHFQDERIRIMIEIPRYEYILRVLKEQHNLHFDSSTDYSNSDSLFEDSSSEGPLAVFGFERIRF